MKIEDFKIGEIFLGSAGFRWLCTDIGTRTITAIHVTDIKNPKWLEGPPYALKEEVFDEEDMCVCHKEFMENLINRVEKDKKSYHPGFEGSIFFKMHNERKSLNKTNKYPSNKENIFKYDRLGLNGEIYHLYAAEQKNNTWYIKMLEIFTEEFLEMSEDEVLNLKRATEDDITKRGISLGRKPLFD